MRTQRWTLLAGIAIFLASGTIRAAERATTDATAVPEAKHTKAGLYVSARQACIMYRLMLLNDDNHTVEKRS